MWRQSGYEGPLVCLNLETPERYKIFGQLPGNCRYVQGDARSLELPDQSFDIVFSNSVIEHVGTWEDQHAFARETARVGKRYWIQTPNKHFPIEPHMNFPYFQFLPRALQERLALVVSETRRLSRRGNEERRQEHPPAYHKGNARTLPNGGPLAGALRPTRQIHRDVPPLSRNSVV
jgi:hypothetical protein